MNLFQGQQYNHKHLVHYNKELLYIFRLCLDIYKYKSTSWSWAQVWFFIDYLKLFILIKRRGEGYSVKFDRVRGLIDWPWRMGSSGHGGQRVRRQGTYLLRINSKYFYFRAWRIDSSSFFVIRGGAGGSTSSFELNKIWRTPMGAWDSYALIIWHMTDLASNLCT